MRPRSRFATAFHRCRARCSRMKPHAGVVRVGRPACGARAVPVAARTNFAARPTRTGDAAKAPACRFRARPGGQPLLVAGRSARKARRGARRALDRTADTPVDFIAARRSIIRSTPTIRALPVFPPLKPAGDPHSLTTSAASMWFFFRFMVFGFSGVVHPAPRSRMRSRALCRRSLQRRAGGSRPTERCAHGFRIHRVEVARSEARVKLETFPIPSHT